MDFESIIGYKAIKLELSRILDQLKHPEKYAELGTPNLAAIYIEDINNSDANTYNVFKKTGTRVLRWNAPDLSLDNMKQKITEEELGLYMLGIKTQEDIPV